MSKKNERLGEVKINRQNCKMTIVEYINTSNVIVEFEDKTKTRVQTTYRAFSIGAIKNPNLPDYKIIESEKQLLGKEKLNNQGCVMKIIEYINCDNIIIEFQDEYKYKRKVQLGNFLKGNVRNPYYKSVCDVGYIGDTSVKNNNILKQSYKTWSDMLRRCYEVINKMYPYYGGKGVTVCDEWHCFKNFEKWYNKNYYEIDGKTTQLDKDILVKGNKQYSPQACIFVPQRINLLFNKSDKGKGLYPRGIIKTKSGKYQTRVYSAGFYKLFDTIEEAFQAYKQAKENQIKKMADEYKDKIPLKLYEAMYNYQVEITD